MKTIKVNGKEFENKTEKLENWYNFTNEQKETICEKYGNPIYLVRQIFDANGQKMTKGQKTLCVFEHGAIVDKTTLNKLCGIEISERSSNGTKTEKTDLQKLYLLLSKLTENDLIKRDKETENDLINIVERLADKVENEKKESEKKAKDDALRNDLLSRGFSEAEVTAILAGPKK
ncbi:MAG: hypothetical protein II604_08875 [Bacteroidales bacterium]|nr:hypothetical protein [Bacteroidales bacterium]